MNKIDEFIKHCEIVSDFEVSKMLRVWKSQVCDWRKGKAIPPYVLASIEAHLMLSKRKINKLKRERL